MENEETNYTVVTYPYFCHILPGITIWDNSNIAAGSVVTKDVLKLWGLSLKKSSLFYVVKSRLT